MKKFLVGLLSAVSILCIVFACNTSVVRAVESSCIINVNVIDILGEYDGKMTLYLRTQNEEQNKEYSVGVYGKKSFITQDFGESAVFGLADTDEWTLVDTKTLLMPEGFEAAAGEMIDMELYVFPTNTNEKYAEYIKELEIGRASVSEVMSAFEEIRAAKDAETEASLAAEAELANQPFDFEIWHEEAMEAFKKFDSLFRSIEDDPTWEQHLFLADATRAQMKDRYLSSVGDATEEKWASYSKVDIYMYYNTYLVYVRFLSGRGQTDYEEWFDGNENHEDYFYEYMISIGAWTGTYGEEMEELYREFAKYQLEYFDEYGMPYNFINDKSYAEEIGLSEGESLPNTEEKVADFTADELNEIREVIKEEGLEDELRAEFQDQVLGEDSADQKSGDSGAFKVIIFIVILLAVAGGGYLVVNNKKKSNSSDNK